MTSEEITFSVVIPLFNKVNVVARAIDSVIAQSYQNYEIIIIDDGSSDSSCEAIRNRYDSKKIIIKEKINGGAGSARNVGIRLSKGEFIAFLDADDCWEPNYLSTVFDVIKSNPSVNFIGCGYANFYKGGYRDEVLYQGEVSESKTVELTALEYFEIIESLGASIHNSSSTVVRTNFLKSNDLFFSEDMSIYEDHSLWYRVIMLTNLILIPFSLVKIYKDAENRSSSRLDSTVALSSLSKLSLILNEFMIKKNLTSTFEVIDSFLMNRAEFIARRSIQNESRMSYKLLLCQWGYKPIYNILGVLCLFYPVKYLIKIKFYAIRCLNFFRNKLTISR